MDTICSGPMQMLELPSRFVQLQDYISWCFGGGGREAREKEKEKPQIKKKEKLKVFSAMVM
jgi:hypothetical protein